jgi:hypothetical protein
MTSVWFSPAPSEITVSRISLDFDLRAADLFFRELVVPGLGRIWFARQLSWPLAALALHEELANHGSNAPKPTAICHGIEALACKLQYAAPDQDTRSQRILGSRAFGRDENSEVWTFRQLHQRRNYVQNTHRQAATRAMNVERGLGFARGSRFDLVELEPVGRDLANTFLNQRVGQGGTTLRTWLVGWLNGDKTLPNSRVSFLQALSPEYPTPQETESVRARLLDADTQYTKEAKEKRQRLAHTVGRAAKMRDIEGDVVVRLRKAGHSEQANQVVTARTFGAVLDRARDAVASLTRRVEPARGGVTLATLTTDSDIKRAFNDLRSATKNYMEKANTAGVNEPTSRAFAGAVAAADDGEAIRLMVRRAGEVLALADGSVIRGALFRVVDATDETGGLEDGAASIEPDRTGRTFRIANFHSLLRDVDPPGAR